MDYQSNNNTPAAGTSTSPGMPGRGDHNGVHANGNNQDIQQQNIYRQTIPGQPQGLNAVTIPGQHLHVREWATGTFDCTKDEESCWWGFWCCWIVHARTAATFTVGSSCWEIVNFWGYVVVLVLGTLIFRLPGFLMFGVVGGAAYAYYRGQMRTELRQKLGIGGTAVNDCISHWLFPCCAVCQEAREAKLVNAPVIDFCSGELMSIQDANHTRAVSSDDSLQGTLMFHLAALSQTSRVILCMWLGVFFVLLVVLLATKQGLNFALLVLIFAQPLLILYFVYWRQKRQHAALDYVVKLFAVGFFCAPFQAIILEGVLQVVITIILAPFSGHTDEDMTDDEQHAVMRQHLTAVVIGLVLMAFLVAAGVEETVKHFVVRCCRFPSQVTNPHTLLVYLMTGALGFATAENIEYVFSEAAGESGMPKVQLFYDELFVLVLRICLPIHVICSVMQAANLSRVVTGMKEMNLFQVSKYHYR